MMIIMCTSVEPEFEISDEVCEIDNSLDHEVSYDYQSSSFEISDSESGDDDLYDMEKGSGRTMVNLA